MIGGLFAVALSGLGLLEYLHVAEREASQVPTERGSVTFAIATTNSLAALLSPAVPIPATEGTPAALPQSEPELSVASDGSRTRSSPIPPRIRTTQLDADPAHQSGTDHSDRFRQARRKNHRRLAATRSRSWQQATQGADPPRRRTPQEAQRGEADLR